MELMTKGGDAMKIILTSSETGDWEGLYVDGLLMVEGHHLSAAEVLRAIGIQPRQIEMSEQWVEESAMLPATEDELYAAIKQYGCRCL